MDFFDQLVNVCVNLFKRAWGNVFVEMTSKGDLVPDFVFASIHPELFNMGRDFGGNVFVNVPREWNVFGVSKVAICFGVAFSVCHDGCVVVMLGKRCDEGFELGGCELVTNSGFDAFGERGVVCGGL